MRYGIFSDIHSNLEALEQVISEYQKENIDEYLCLGDIVGYAANPKECILKVRSLAKVTVAGNHDWASAGIFSTEYFNEFARLAVLWTGDILDEAERSFLQSLRLTFENNDLTLVHGTLDNPEEFEYLHDGYAARDTFALLDTEICFVGHTHFPGVFIRDKVGNIGFKRDSAVDLTKGRKYIVNVGSVGQPRDHNPKACYCVYDSGKRRIEIKRADYDSKLTRKKIIDAGLPHFLGDRLLSGT